MRRATSATSAGRRAPTLSAKVGTRPSRPGRPCTRTASGSPSRNRSPSARSCAWIASQPSSSTYSIAAIVPARASWASVPVSNRCESGSSGAGRTLYGRQRSSTSRRPVEDALRAARRTCTASRAGRRLRPPRRRSGRAARSARHRPRPGRRRRARGLRSGATSVSVPTAFDAHGKATTRVRDESCRSSSSRSSRHSSSTSTNRTTRSLSRASSSQGETFASWSRRVTTTSSPALPVARGRSREREVERRHVRAEADLVGCRTQEARNRSVGLLDDLDRFAGSSRKARRDSRSTRASTPSSRRRPSPEPASRPARRRTRSAGQGRGSAHGLLRRRARRCSRG